MLYMFDIKKKSDLKISDMVLLSLLYFPNGAMGEGRIQEFLYELTRRDEFKEIGDQMMFIEHNGKHASLKIHDALIANSKDMTASIHNKEFVTPTSSTSAIIADDLRFEVYEEVLKRDMYLKEVMTYEPKVYFLSAMGRSVAILALREKLSKSQKAALPHLK